MIIIMRQKRLNLFSFKQKYFCEFNEKIYFAFNSIIQTNKQNKQIKPNLILIVEVNDRCFGRAQIHNDHAARLVIACDFFWMNE